MAVVRRFQDLDVWQKAFEVSLAIHRKSLGFPKIEQYALADQMRRASKSVCANVAEGFSKQSSSKPEFKRFLNMAMASANEMQVWILYTKELDYISQSEFDHWNQEYNSIAKMLNSFIAKV